jgi:heme-degrading monooxygenase HmoA
MTQSVLRFALLPGRRDDFVETFRRIEVLETSSALPGYRGGQLFADVEDPDTALVTAQWDSPAAYQEWLDHPAREEIGEQLRPFWAEDPQGAVFELVHDVAARARA